MRTLAFDGRTGASGDMLLGALIDVGADPAALEPVADVLHVEFHRTTVDRHGISATDVRVVRPDGTSVEHHDPESDHHPHRSYEAVLERVRSMALPASAMDAAVEIFEALGTAEAAVHGTDLSETTFHEVGADDAIADVAGVAALLADLDVESIITTPVALGGGEVTFTHGTYPVPTPAVVELLEDADIESVGGPVDEELLTPTGAAILATVASGVSTLPSMRVEASGYGAGTRELAGRPNVLRATLGTRTGTLHREEIRLLETNVDDVSPEVIGDLHDRLASAGALDVSVVPLGMKKSRPGHLIRVVVQPGDAEAVARQLVAETGTLGIRDAGTTHRWVAERHRHTVSVQIGDVEYDLPVKVAQDTTGTVLDVSAEHDDARTVADQSGTPIRTVMARAEAVARETLDS